MTNINSNEATVATLAIAKIGWPTLHQLQRPKTF